MFQTKVTKKGGGNNSGSTSYTSLEKPEISDLVAKAQAEKDLVWRKAEKLAQDRRERNRCCGCGC
jgi:hypothetical protein